MLLNKGLTHGDFRNFDMVPVRGNDKEILGAVILKIQSGSADVKCIEKKCEYRTSKESKESHVYHLSSDDNPAEICDELDFQTELPHLSFEIKRPEQEWLDAVKLQLGRGTICFIDAKEGEALEIYHVRFTYDLDLKTLLEARDKILDGMEPEQVEHYLETTSSDDSE